MMKSKCEHKIGVWYEWEDTDILTFEELKKAVEWENTFRKEYPSDEKQLVLLDYCDKRKNTNFTRFEYCPICGKKIDWNAIRMRCKNR